VGELLRQCGTKYPKVGVICDCGQGYATTVANELIHQGVQWQHELWGANLCVCQRKVQHLYPDHSVHTYCQSMHHERSPRPSFPLAPPKRYVKVELCWFARQKIEIPAVSGKIYSGTISQTMIKNKTAQKTLRRRFASSLCKCRDWKREARGRMVGQSIFVGYTKIFLMPPIKP